MRKLRDEAVIDKPVSSEDQAQAQVKLPTNKIVRTVDGQLAQIEDTGFNVKSLERMKPYTTPEDLPGPVMKTNKRGISYVAKLAEPRFRFEGNTLVKIQRGIGGIKKSNFWTYRPLNPNRSRNQTAINVRNYLKRIGIPGA